MTATLFLYLLFFQVPGNIPVACDPETKIKNDQRVCKATDEVVVGRSPNVTLEPGDIVYVPESFF